VLAHQPLAVANSILWSGAVLLLGTYLVMVDELQGFVSPVGGTTGSVQSETRKFNLIAMLSQQALDQVPGQMRSGLRNVEVDTTFRTGRDAAEYLSQIMGSVDPFSIR